MNTNSKVNSNFGEKVGHLATILSFNSKTTEENVLKQLKIKKLAITIISYLTMILTTYILIQGLLIRKETTETGGLFRDNILMLFEVSTLKAFITDLDNYLTLGVFTVGHVFFKHILNTYSSIRLTNYRVDEKKLNKELRIKYENELKTDKNGKVSNYIDTVSNTFSTSSVKQMLNLKDDISANFRMFFTYLFVTFILLTTYTYDAFTYNMFGDNNGSAFWVGLATVVAVVLTLILSIIVIAYISAQRPETVTDCIIRNADTDTIKKLINNIKEKSVAGMVKEYENEQVFYSEGKKGPIGMLIDTTTASITIEGIVDKAAKNKGFTAEEAEINKAYKLDYVDTVVFSQLDWLTLDTTNMIDKGVKDLVA